MVFGIILSIICCVLLLVALIKITLEARGKNADWSTNVIYFIAPYGLAISVFYYVFFWRAIDLAEMFAGFNTFNIFVDIIFNVILPAAILTALVLSYRMLDKVGWQFFIIAALLFILLCWLYVIIEVIGFSGMHSAGIKPPFPIVQWSCAVFIAALIVAISERRYKAEAKAAAGPVPEAVE